MFFKTSNLHKSSPFYGPIRDSQENSDRNISVQLIAQLNHKSYSSTCGEEVDAPHRWELNLK